MRQVKHSVWLLGKTKLSLAIAEDYLNYHGVTNYNYGHGTDADVLVSLAGKRCYMSFEVGLNANVTKIRTELSEYIDNILKVGHGSVLEHVNFTFAIEGISRVCTAELNRHRAGVSISEGSLRYIRFDDLPYWLPTCISTTEDDLEFYHAMRANMHTDMTPDQSARYVNVKKRLESQTVFQTAFRQMEENYKDLQGIWGNELQPESSFHGKKELTSMMRRIVGLGVATGGIWTFNVRSLRHILELRSGAGAEEEIMALAAQLITVMQQQEPTLFADFESVEGLWKPKYSKV
jgi:thymidylate synthase (FAD)